ncbi:hypothetical protein [Agromyces humi]|uniref:hypothetical protein n=1 Tax=Agromyces humi TaxID=1766800 RepID=UPI001357B17B|nr:hypothetical protein [Agromyces humi]
MKKTTPVAVLAAAIALSLAGCAPATNVAETAAAPSAAPVINFTPTEEDTRADIMAGCLTELGWEGLVVNWDGGIDTGHIPEEQQDQFQADSATCIEAFPVVPLTDAEIREMYAAEVANSDCLVGLGYAMPQTPTEQTYVDTYGTENQWFAMVGASPQTMKEETYKDVFTTCPPPAWQE